MAPMTVARMNSKNLSSAAHLVGDTELGRCEEGLEAVEGCANLASTQVETEIEFAHVAAAVHEGMHVLLQQQVLQHAALGHQPEQVKVAAEELRMQKPVSSRNDVAIIV